LPQDQQITENYITLYC